jgi:hypothetical protein
MSRLGRHAVRRPHLCPCGKGIRAHQTKTAGANDKRERRLGKQRVGWVERSIGRIAIGYGVSLIRYSRLPDGSRRRPRRGLMGFAALNPSYGLLTAFIAPWASRAFRGSTFVIH